MLQITPQMKILVAVEPADFRKGIDGLVRLCKDVRGFRIRLPQSPGHSDQSAGVRRPGILAVSQTSVRRTIPLVAIGIEPGHPGEDTGGSPVVGSVFCRQSGANGSGTGLASGRSAQLVRGGPQADAISTETLRCRSATVRATDGVRKTALDS